MITMSVEQTAPLVGDSVGNEGEILKRSDRALGGGADVVVFPELAQSGYVTDRDLVGRAAQAVDGPFVNALSKLTSRRGGLIAAGFCERDGRDFFNSVVLVGPDGPLHVYRKLHLFDAEFDSFTAGQALETVTVAGVTYGVCVCYDLRFVEVLRGLSLRGADIVLAPAAWVGGFDQHVPASGLVAQAEGVIVQANLDQVAVVAVSQAPTGAPGQPKTLGGSLVVDARGSVVAGPLSRSGPDRAMVTLDVDDIRSARVRAERIRPRTDRRTDVYGIAIGEEIL